MIQMTCAFGQQQTYHINYGKPQEEVYQKNQEDAKMID